MVIDIVFYEILNQKLDYLHQTLVVPTEYLKVIKTVRNYSHAD